MSLSLIARRRLAAVLSLLFAAVVVAYATQAVGSGGSQPKSSHAIVFVADGRVVARVRTEPFELHVPSEQARLRRVIMKQLPSSVSTVRRGARVTSDLVRGDAVAAALKLSGADGSVKIDTTPTTATIDAPIIKQKLRNNCEATALQILLETVGRTSSQIALQNELP